jgi:hypothetical protein
MKAIARQVSAVLTPSQIDLGADGMPELHASAELPGAPEAPGAVAELRTWDEPIDERGHRVGFATEDDPTIAECLVQQGANEADAEIRELGDKS